MRSITGLSLTSGLLLIVLLAAIAFGLEPQAEQEIKPVLSRFMDEARQGYLSWEPVNRIAEEYGVSVVPYVEDYYTDPCDRVRWHAYALVWKIGLAANDVPGRQLVVDKLLARLRDDPADGNRQWLANRLLQFTSADFSEASRRSVRELLLRALADSKINPRRDIILLAGVAGLKSELPRLKEFIDEREGKLKQEHEEHLAEWRQVVERMPEWRKAYHARSLMKQYWQSSLVWAALRARARMGVKEDIARCIQLADSHPDEDYKARRLLRELAYVRQPEVVDYIYDYLKSDEVEKVKGRDVVRMSHAQRAAMALAEMLRRFPGRKDIGGDAKTIERCSKWMAEQKQKQKQEKKQWDIIR